MLPTPLPDVQTWQSCEIGKLERARQGSLQGSNPRVTVSWQILKVVQPEAEEVQTAWDAGI
jgi:hypothetical protein